MMEYTADRALLERKGKLSTIRTAIWSTFLFGVLAYAYIFLSFFPSHDSLNEFFMDAGWQLSLGRFGVPVYQSILGMTVTTTWTGGMVGLLWIALTVYFMARIFDITQTGHIVFTSAIFTANTTILALAATYMPFFGPQTLATALATAAAYCWKLYCDRKQGWWLGLGVLALVMSLSLYQAQASMTIASMMIFSILEFLKNGHRKNRGKQILCNGLMGMGMIALGVALYYLLVNICLAISGTQLADTYNSINNVWKEHQEPLVKRMISCSRQVFRCLFDAPGYVYPEWVATLLIVLWAMLVLAGGAGLFLAKKRKIWVQAVIVLLVVLLPLGMNIASLWAGESHQLMYYAVFMLYFCVVLLMKELNGRRARWIRVYRAVAVFWLAALITSQIQTANLLGVQKHMTHNTTLSIMTRVLDRIEQTEDYEPGETPVVFIGSPQGASSRSDIMEKITGVVGMYSTTSITYEDTYEDYFAVVLQCPVNLRAANEIEITEDIAAMPIYPSSGSVCRIDGAVIVKFEEDAF